MNRTNTDSEVFRPLHPDVRKLLDEAADHLRGRYSMDGGDADDAADLIEELMDRYDAAVKGPEKSAIQESLDRHGYDRGMSGVRE